MLKNIYFGSVPKARNLIKSKETISHFMYMDDIKNGTKNEKERDNLIQIIKIYRQVIGTEFIVENVSYWLGKVRKKRNK